MFLESSHIERTMLPAIPWEMEFTGVRQFTVCGASWNKLRHVSVLQLANIEKVCCHCSLPYLSSNIRQISSLFSLLGKSPTETHGNLIVVYGDKVL